MCEAGDVLVVVRPDVKGSGFCCLLLLSCGCLAVGRVALVRMAAAGLSLSRALGCRGGNAMVLEGRLGTTG